jgi:tetratricopeptide (TPR) repeat protein
VVAKFGRHAGEIERAKASCTEAARYDAANPALLALQSELNMADAPADFGALKERARSRYGAGHFTAAMDAYATLAKWPAAPMLDRAAAASNQALCYMRLGKHESALAACKRAVALLTTSSKAGNDSTRQLGSLEIAEVGVLEQAVAHVVAALDSAGDSGRGAAQLGMKVLTRAASCSAHMRRFTIAAAQYRAAAQLAVALQDEEAAVTLRRDAEHVMRLEVDSCQDAKGSSSSTDVQGALNENTAQGNSESALQAC